MKANKVPGRYGDGDGLFLLIGPSGSKSWVVRVQKDGRRRDFGLGSEKKLSLAMARMRGLTSFLDTLPPHKQKWHRIVLTVGRRELRKGGQYGAQTYAIKQIISALKAANERFPDTDRGDATTTIKKLLSGQSGTKDITGHFSGPGSDQPQKADVPPDLNG